MILHRNPSSSVRAMAVLAALALNLHGVTALAQSRSSDKQAKQLELESVTHNLSAAERRQAELKQQIEQLDQDMGAINRALVEGAKRGQALEDAITATEAKLHKLLQSQSGLRASLYKKKDLLAEVLGALQRMGRDPPPAIVVRPEDALGSVRSAILLGAVVPHIRSETALLLSDLTALSEISAAVETEKASLTQDLNLLAEDETRLSLLVEEKLKLATQSRQNLVTERKKAIELGQKAQSLKYLIQSLESEIASASAAAKAAKLADERRRQQEVERLATAQEKQKNKPGFDEDNTLITNRYDPNRQEPAIGFSQAQGTLLRPVSGEVLYGFGHAIPGARKSTSMALASRPNARVRSPTDGWVVYAGPFRSYGQVLILNAGEGYHMVLSGLAEVNVETGRFVLAGEPIGRMGVVRFAAVMPLDLGSKKPVLTVELRKDGKSIDPAPWWAVQSSSNERIRSKRGT